MTERPSLSRPVVVPASRVGRLARMGGLAGTIAGSVAVGGLRALGQGQRPEMRDLLLTPGNVGRVADQLARMRGAAMKVGQLISMDPGEMLPPELAAIMARLRADADHMPPKQLRDVLDANWGAGWRRRFAAFDVRPIAAASIGQVHRARLPDGRTLAIKVQYPGVRASIDSDVANVGALMRMSGLVPPGLDTRPLLDEARRQLHEEADYLREANEIKRFSTFLKDDSRYVLPAVEPGLTTRDVLAMRFCEGDPIETLAGSPPGTRDRAAADLIDLLLRELFEFRAMQTDPNFANFRFDPATGRIVLLDFGATRAFPADLVERYRALLANGLAGDREGLRAASRAIGFFDAATDPRHQDMVLGMMTIVFDLLSAPGPVALDDPALLSRLRQAGEAMARERDFVHVPPMDVLYLQRKFAGMFLLAARLGARVALRPLVERYL